MIIIFGKATLLLPDVWLETASCFSLCFHQLSYLYCLIYFYIERPVQIFQQKTHKEYGEKTWSVSVCEVSKTHIDIPSESPHSVTSYTTSRKATRISKKKNKKEQNINTPHAILHLLMLMSLVGFHPVVGTIALVVPLSTFSLHLKSLKFKLGQTGSIHVLYSRESVCT